MIQTSVNIKKIDGEGHEPESVNFDLSQLRAAMTVVGEDEAGVTESMFCTHE
jgi:hypothetical protein